MEKLYLARLEDGKVLVFKSIYPLTSNWNLEDAKKEAKKWNLTSEIKKIYNSDEEIY